MFLVQITQAFKADPKPFKGHVTEISLAILDGFDDSTLSNGLSFIWELAKVYPEVRTPIKLIVRSCSGNVDLFGLVALLCTEYM